MDPCKMIGKHWSWWALQLECSIQRKCVSNSYDILRYVVASRIGRLWGHQTHLSCLLTLGTHDIVILRFKDTLPYKLM